jgi:hypothetical protein
MKDGGRVEMTSQGLCISESSVASSIAWLKSFPARVLCGIQNNRSDEVLSMAQPGHISDDNRLAASVAHPVGEGRQTERSPSPLPPCSQVLVQFHAEQARLGIYCKLAA